MAVLEVRRPDREPETVRVTRRKPVTVGSHPNSNVAVDEVDPLYCRIAWNGEGYEVIAAGSDDVDLNGTPTRQSLIGDGDKIRVAGVVIKMHRGNSPSKRNGEAEDDAGAGAAGGGALDDLLDDDFEDTPEEPPSRSLPPPVSGAEISAADVVEEPTAEARPTEPVRDPVKMSVRDRIRSRRPGQNSPLRSPFIYAMSALVVALMVSFLALALFIRGKAIDEEYNVARAAHAAGKFGDAETKLTEFLLRHPGHPLADEAEKLLSFTKVDRLIKGASPDFGEGLKSLESTVATFREDAGFGEMEPEIADRAGVVSLGSALDAGRERDEGLIDLSRRAEKVLTEFSSVPPKGLLDEINEARRESRETIIRLNVRDNFLARMTAAEQGGRPLEVIDQYIAMVSAEPGLANDRETSRLNEAARESVVSAVQTTEFEPKTVEANGASDWAVQTIAVVERPAGEGEGDGVAIAVWADDTLFAADRQSGDPLWRRSFAGSFEPVQVDVPLRGRLVYDRATGSLVLISDEDGQTVGSLGIASFEAAPRRPTVEDGTAYVPVGETLLRVSLSEMRVTAAAEFGQPILAEPAYVRGERPAVLALGDEQMTYLLDAGTLELRDSLVLGHDRGTIIAPPLAAAEFSIVVVNDAKRSSTMHLLSDRDGELVVADTAPIEGLVVDPPVLRGRNLYVPTSGEIVAVMAVRDDDGGRLAGGPKFSPGNDESRPVPAFLLAESDREFWLAGRRLRRLRVTAESVQPVDRAIPLGRPTQPPIGARDGVLVAARRGDDDAVTLSRVEADEMRERWQTHFAGELIAVVPVGDSDLVGVTSHGHFVRVGLSDEGFQTSAVDKSDATPSSAVALSNRIAVADGEKIVFVSTTGRRQQVVELGEPATAPLVNWNDSLVIPLAGKLRVIAQRGRVAPADFWLGEQGEDAAGWTSVQVLDENRLLTTDDGGTVRVLTLATEPRPFLAESAAAALPEGTTLVAAGGGRVVAAAGSRLVMLDPGSLAETGALDLSGATPKFVTVGPERTVVLGEADGRTVVSSIEGEKVVASRELEDVAVAPAREEGGQIVVTLEHAVVTLSAGELEPVANWELPSRAAGAARLVSGRWVVPLDDGGVATKPAE